MQPLNERQQQALVFLKNAVMRCLRENLSIQFIAGFVAAILREERTKLK